MLWRDFIRNYENDKVKAIINREKVSKKCLKEHLALFSKEHRILAISLQRAGQIEDSKKKWPLLNQ